MKRESRGPKLTPETWPFDGELPNIVGFDEILGHRTSPPGPEPEKAPSAIPDGHLASWPDDTPTEPATGIPTEPATDGSAEGPDDRQRP